MKRICIVDPVLTRYRMPVFAELSKHCNVDWVFSPSRAGSGFGNLRRTETPRLRYIEISAFRPFGEKIGIYQLGILKYILTEKPDCIKVFGNPRYLSFWTTLILARARGIPFHAHGVGFFKRDRVSLVRRLMMKTMLRLVTSYIAYAPIVRDSFAANGFPLDKIIVVHNSLVNSFQVRPDEKIGQESGILFVGRLRPRSGLELLIRVLGLLHQDDGFPLTLHVIGVGKEAESLQRQAAGCSWVNWYRDASDERVSEISRRCLVGCYPGAAGLSVVHMMSLSLPVILHNDFTKHEGPEASYVRNGINGILYDHAHAEASLSQTLRAIAENRSAVIAMQRAAFETYQDLVNPSYAERLWSILGQESVATAEALGEARL